MTNAEAIETLRANYPDACYEQLREAVDAAIEALTALQTDGDCISRQAAKEELCKNINVFGEIPHNDAMCAIDKLPSAQPEAKKATWALHTYMPHRYYCTNCKKDSPYNKVWEHCPHCGGKMEDYV